MLLGPGEAQNRCRKQDGKTLDFQHLRGQKKAHKIATELVQAIPRDFPACTGLSVMQT